MIQNEPALQQPKETLLSLRGKSFAWLRNNHLFVLALFVFLLFFLLIIFSNILFPKSSDEQKMSSITPSPSPSTLPSPIDTPYPTEEIRSEQTATEAGYIAFVEYSEMATESKKEQLPDGATKYTYASENPNREDVTIVKNGEIILSRHAVVGQRISDGYKNLHGQQEYTLPGPTFYGPATVIYFYEKGGTALIVDPQTSTTYEEFSFQPPISLQEFLSQYRVLAQ